MTSSFCFQALDQERWQWILNFLTRGSQSLQHYDEYKNADPGGIGWALDRQVFKWEVPFHDGAIEILQILAIIVLRLM